MTFHPTHGEREPRVHFTADDIRELREEAKDRRGLYDKFVVFKTEDGKIVGDPISDFFVLRPRSDVHALEALRTYAKSAGYEGATRNLARDLGKWIADIERERTQNAQSAQVKDGERG